MQSSLENVNSMPTMTDKTQITSTDDLETRRGHYLTQEFWLVIS